MVKIRFNSIGNSVSIHFNVSEFSSRDKVELFNYLMDDLGITERCNENPDETAGFQEIWKEQIDKAWEGDD